MSDVSSVTSAVPGLASTPSTQPTDVTGQDTFLSLLTVQLQNQDPTSPINNEDFLAQMAQFTQVQELMSIRQSLEAVYSGIAAVHDAGMADLLGSEVLAVGNQISMNGEPKDLHFQSSAALEDATLTIRDESGQIVRTLSLGALPEGEGSISWDGLDDNGNPVPDGTYNFSVVGVDETGATVQVQTLMQGIVSEMDYTSGSPMPSIDGVPVSLSDILKISI